MAVAHSAASESHTGTTGSTNQASFNWTHTQTGTPQGVVVFVHATTSTNLVSSVTYGSVTLTAVSGGSAVDTAGEFCRTDVFFAGSGLPAGNQTITVNRTNTTNVMYATAATVTAGADTAIPTSTIVLLEGDGTLAQQNVNDTSPGQNSVRYAGLISGLNNVAATGANSTLLQSIDFGTTYTCLLVRETTAGQGSRPVGFSSGTTDDRAAVHLAVRELVPRTETPIVGTFTLTGNQATLSRNLNLNVDAGSFALTGQPATLTRNLVLNAETGAFNLFGGQAQLLKGYNFVANTGIFALTGNPATFDIATPAKVLLPEVGTFALTGNPVSFFIGRNLLADTGVFSLTGNDATLTVARKLDSALGKFFLPERNLFLWSEEFDNAVWTKTNAIITSNVIAAFDNSTTADRLTENSATNEHYIEQTYSVIAGKTYTFSCFAKPQSIGGRKFVLKTTLQGDAAVSFDLDAINATTLDPTNLISSGISSVTSGWYRCNIVFTATGTGSAAFRLHLYDGLGSLSYAGDGSSSINIHGAQLEESSVAVGYDPTGPARAPLTNLIYDVKLSADTGAFNLTGNPATLIKTTAKELLAQTGAFSFTGNNVSFKKDWNITADTGIFSFTGNSATFERSSAFIANTGEFNFNGQPVIFTRNVLLNANRGQFDLVGNDATFNSGRTLGVTTGSFVLTGNPVDIVVTDILEAGTGAFILTGLSASLVKSGGARRRNVLIF